MSALLLFLGVSALSRGLTALLHAITCTILGLSFHYNLTTLLVASVFTVAIAISSSASVGSVSLHALLYR